LAADERRDAVFLSSFNQRLPIQSRGNLLADLCGHFARHVRARASQQNLFF
jgi:hypothetical protein